MNRLTKLKLINWMYFQNQTIEFNGNTVITGGNASGKSTILDALQMLLLGNQKSRFNSNAEGQKRTLESYVRGAITTENKAFLRDGDVITYLAMQLDKADTSYIFGEFISYTLAGGISSEPKYFLIKNVNITDDLFIKDNYPKTFDELKKYCNEYKYEFKPCYTLTEYQKELRDALGLKNDKAFYRILKEAVSIKNIQDVNDFIFNFVLEDNKIDIDEINEASNEMEKLRRKIERDLEKQEMLNDVLELDSQILNNNYDIITTDCTKNIASLKYNENRINDLNVEIKKNDIEVEKLNNMKESYQVELDTLRERKTDNENRLNNLSPELKYKKNELEMARDRVLLCNSNVIALESKLEDILGKLEQIKSLDLSCIDKFIKNITNKVFSSTSLKSVFENFKEDISTYKDDYLSDINKVSQSIEKIILEIKDRDDRIQSLENNKVKINPMIEEYKYLLEQTLHDKYKKWVDVKYLYELLDIDNEEWRDAIEGYLGLQRYHIIVDPMYYYDAIELLHVNKKYYEPKIVNVGKIGDLDATPNTLAMYVKGTNGYALNYARYLLNKVHCANTIKDLDKYEVSITKDCMKYQNYTTSRINPKIYAEKVIGIEGRKLTIINLKKERDRLSNQLNEKKALKQRVEGLLSSINFIINEVDNIRMNHDIFTSFDEKEKLDNKIVELENYINEFENNETFIDIKLKLEEIKNSMNGLNLSIRSIDNDLISLKGKNENYKQKIVELETKNKYINLTRFDDVTLSDSNSILANKSLNKELIISLDEKYESLLKKDSKLRSDIAHRMSEYNKEFLLNAEPEYESISIYKKERDSLSDELTKYQAKSVELERSFRKAFLTSFIAKLYDRIETAKKTIKDLNKKFDEFKIEKHEIKFQVTGDSDLAKIYNFAKTYGAERDIFNSEDRDNAQPEVENIINKYMNSANLSDKNLICDYRNYLDFDILIGSENRKSYKQVCKVQSGGEGQTPFYMLAAVAFMQTLDARQNDTLAIVLFDEVFDKMDSTRIRDMLNLYNSFPNLQMIIALPKNIEAVSDVVGSIKVVCRSGEVAEVASYEIKNRISKNN